ncbi:NADPH-dependent FMN reductase [Tumidithrix helvetica]|uniref:NADPH-dependent FMN reductase n=1 Tax=Tumidithrix helvetica TaxID=3457545 RepID=UPI003CC5A608
MANILLIGGSPIHPSRSHGLLHYTQELLECQSISCDVLLVRDLPAEALILGRFSSPILEYPKKLIKDADGLIIASPIYKGAYTGLLKSFLDLLPRGSLSNKVILPLSTSITINNFLAIDFTLKPVLAELGATHILPSVFAVDVQLQRNEDGSFIPHIEVVMRLQKSLNELVDSLNLLRLKRNLNENFHKQSIVPNSIETGIKD